MWEGKRFKYILRNKYNQYRIFPMCKAKEIRIRRISSWRRGGQMIEACPPQNAPPAGHSNEYEWAGIPRPSLSIFPGSLFVCFLELPAQLLFLLPLQLLSREDLDLRLLGVALSTTWRTSAGKTERNVVAWWASFEYLKPHEPLEQPIMWVNKYFRS